MFDGQSMGLAFSRPFRHFFVAIPPHFRHNPFNKSNPSTHPMDIRLKEYIFTLSEPYCEGTILTKEEAQALNGLRAENIRNNMAKAVAAETDSLPEGQMLSLSAVRGLQAKIDQYAKAYRFPLRNERARRVQQGSVDAEAFAMARDLVEEERRGQGMDMNGEGVEMEIRMLASTPDVQLAARQRLAAKRDIAQSALEELL